MRSQKHYQTDQGWWNKKLLNGASLLEDRAVIVAEMEVFSQRYGFRFVCHAIDHPNRKAGNERSFWSVETSFLPGRTFTSLEDLNAQAHQYGPTSGWSSAC